MSIPPFPDLELIRHIQASGEEYQANRKAAYKYRKRFTGLQIVLMVLAIVVFPNSLFGYLP
ncbi:MAG: hypothetical protein NE334_05800 [Lentisphaeraceae bacterium]|nr:hypothetical protein [Lentisphaeraceae bacterium]